MVRSQQIHERHTSACPVVISLLFRRRSHRHYIGRMAVLFSMAWHFKEELWACYRKAKGYTSTQEIIATRISTTAPVSRRAITNSSPSTALSTPSRAARTALFSSWPLVQTCPLSQREFETELARNMKRGLNVDLFSVSLESNF